MVAEKHRIIIWPSDGNDVPKLPVLSFDATDANTSTSSDIDAINQNTPGSSVAIIGWVDETVSVVTIIAIGSMLLPLASEDVEKPKRGTECKDGESVALCCKTIISPAINCLAEQYPCKYSTDGCGSCYHCTTYQSLGVLGIIRNPVKDENDEPDSKRKEENIQNSRRQIILYNQNEAQRWHHQYFNSSPAKNQQQENRNLYLGTWQRNAFRMAESWKVLEKLSWTMKDIMQQCQPEEKIDVDFDDTTAMSKGETEHSADIGYAKIESSVDQRQKASCFGGISSHSLLLQHLKSRRPSSQKAEPNIFAQIPLFSILGHLIRANTAPRKTNGSGLKGESRFANSQFVALILDSLIGLVIGCILLTYPHIITQRIIHLWNDFHNRQWNEGLQWLESFPAGFKLNVALTQQMGKEVRLALQYHQQIMSFLFPVDFCVDTAATDTYSATSTPLPATLVWYLGLSTIVFGARFFFAFAFDITRLSLLHIHYLSSLFAACQRLELSTLTSLWLLFRGKKRNVLRQRSDHLKYDHMQLLLGMIIFTVCLFLFTTILVYHWFFAIMNCYAELCVCGLWWCGFMSVEGVAKCDKIVTEKRRCQNDSEKSWIGKGVKFIPVILSDMSYFGYFLGGIGTILLNDSKILILQRPTFERVSQESTMKNVSCVSVTSNKTSTMKVEFPSKSSPSIILSICCSFIISRFSRIMVFTKRLVFGTPCPIASTYVELCQ